MLTIVRVNYIFIQPAPDERLWWKAPIFGDSGYLFKNWSFKFSPLQCLALKSDLFSSVSCNASKRKYGEQNKLHACMCLLHVVNIVRFEIKIKKTTFRLSRFVYPVIWPILGTLIRSKKLITTPVKLCLIYWLTRKT